MYQALPRKARNGHAAAPRILEYYERRVLPTLFERLDRAFPELQWTRDGDGWTGLAPAKSHGIAASCVRLQCKHPWGFVDSTGNAVSWLTHAHGGQPPTPERLVETIRQLAQRAGLDDAPLAGRFSREDQIEAHRAERQRELLEAFVAYCHATMCSDAGHQALDYLQRNYGINGHEAGDLPLGVYTSQKDVREHLTGVGFSDEEIAESRVVRDVRLDGRIIIPWRDRRGLIRRVVAHETGEKLHGLPRQLYRRADETEDAFGLDVALRPSSGGRDHLILVEGLLDVVYFQTHGLPNVATFGAAGKVPTVVQWERLAQLGVRQVTLALNDDEAGWERTLLALDHAYRAAKSPQVFALRRRAFDTAQGAATAARIQGLGRFRHVVSQRLHGFHYIAKALIEEHKPGSTWTDPALVALLGDAIDFDACVYRPRRAWELERFFWRPLLEEIGADWDTIRHLLRRPIDETVRVVRARPVEIPQPAPAPEPAPRPAPQIAAPPPPPPVAPPIVRVRREPIRIAQPVVEQRVVKVPLEPEPEPLPVDLNELAYKVWVERGRPEGKHHECWYEAEQIVRRRQANGERIYAKSA